MNRSALLLTLLGLLAAPLAQADEPSVCTAACTSEKEQCTVRANKLAELDRRPTAAEANPILVAGGPGLLPSESGRVTERVAAPRRDRERVDACNASYKRCAKACEPAAAPAAEQSAPAK